jgi:probable rRNA maturation factor
MVRVAKRGFSISYLSKDTLPAGIPFETIKRDILGDAYDLSLVIVSDAKSRALNRAYRKRSYTPNVLSFPLSGALGEIFLNLRQARREHQTWGHTLRDHVALLFVHACLHLKGERHGRTMQEEEQRILRRRIRGYRS